MEPPSLFFQTDSNGTFSFRDGYDCVSDHHLVALYMLIHEALLSLETEIEERPIMVNINAQKALTKIHKNFKLVKSKGMINKKVEPLIKNAIKAVSSRPFKNRGYRRYQDFFLEICRLENRGLFALCAASLGKDKLRNMKKADRDSLLHYFGKNISTFECDKLEQYAATNEVPELHSIAFEGAKNSRDSMKTAQESDHSRKLP